MRARRVVAVAAVLLTSSCSSAEHGNARSEATSVASETVAPSVSAAATPPASSDQVTSLTCADSGHPTTPASTYDVNASGLTFSGVEPVRERLSSPLPVVGGGRELFFEKVFLYVSMSASMTTHMTLIAPTDAYLYYTDSKRGSRGSMTSR
jgi:hypothetical protein